MKKILFVSPFAYPLFAPECELKFGGAEVQMYLLAKELAKDDNFSVNFAVLDVGQEQKQKIENVNVYTAYKRGRNILNLIKAPCKLFNLLKYIKPDIVINRAHGVEAGICAFYCKLNKSKFIYSIASDFDITGDRFQGFRGKIFKYGFYNAEKLIAQSKDQMNLLSQISPEQYKKSVLIKNSFLIENTEKEKNNVLWVGSSADVKRPQVFVDLAKKFPEQNFVMIMTKSGVNIDLWYSIKKQIEKLENIELIEKVPFKEIKKYFAQAKVFINTSRAEGFPNTFLQAINGKTPILSLRVDPDNFIVTNKCGLECADDIQKLEDNLKKLLKDKVLRETMGANGQEYIKENHNLEKNIEKWKEVFNNC